MKILIADDERMVRLSFLSMCEELYPDTHQYLEARNGKELIRLVTEERPDVVFVDIRMPLLDGLNAVEQLTASQPDIYFIILSGYSDFSYAQKAIQLGVRNYLLKPLLWRTFRMYFFRPTRKKNANFWMPTRAFSMKSWHSSIPIIYFLNWKRRPMAICPPIFFMQTITRKRGSASFIKNSIKRYRRKYHL